VDILISSGVFAIVLALSLILLTGGNRDREHARAQAMLDEVTRTDDADFDVTRTDPRRRVLQPLVMESLYRLSPLRRLEESIWQAGVYMHISEMVLITVLLFGAGATAVQLVWRDVWFALAGGAGVGSIPILYIRLKRKRRLKAFSQQLPFALDLIKSSLEAGHSVLRGMQVLVEEFGEPLGPEFRTVLEQTRLGMPM
jgi:tight adherence protein B